MKYTLGIDLGVASIGWAAVSEAEGKIDAGVRVFPPGLDAFGTSKEANANENRRTSRGTRRRIRRKAQRKLLLRKNLEILGWVPSSKHERDDAEVREWESLDPYELRSKAIKEQISLPELGRILLHLNQRRGFLSLRKSEEASADKETKGILGEMSALATDIEQSGYKTLGNYLFHLREEDLKTHVYNEKKQATIRLRNRHLQRKLNHTEFDLIWNKQKEFYPDSLTDKLRYGVKGKLENPIAVVKPDRRIEGLTLLEQYGLENLLFFQRRVYWPASSIGLCQLEQPILFSEMKESGILTNKKKKRELERSIRRAPISDRRFQEFRMLCEVNNMKLTVLSDLPLKERAFTEEERQITLEYAKNTATSPTFKSLKTKLAKHLSLESPSQLLINLEAGERTKFSGMLVDSTMSGKKGLGKVWNTYDEETKNQLIEIIGASENTDEDIAEALAEFSFLSKDEKEILLRIPFGSARCNLSIKALEKLLPHLRKGMIYMDTKDSGRSALHAAGYTRNDEQSHATLDLLPRFDDPMLPYSEMVTNPVVRRALTELRKVVNGIIRKHGKPSAIHVEMMRDLKMSPKQRAEYGKRTNKLEKERSEARAKIEEHGLIANRDAVERYLLWQQQGERSAYDPTKTISLSQLFSGDVDVDHILPYSRSADNTFNNKCVCFREENALKSNLTPYEWLGNDDEAYQQITQFAYKRLQGGGKYKKFSLKEIPEGFTERDLRDTAWMAKAARQYLAVLFPSKESYKVLGTKGAHTSTLRDMWQINSLLRKDGIELKTREDHRHHALDAVVIALTNPQRIKQIVASKKFTTHFKDAHEPGKKVYRLKSKVEPLALPWESFRENLSHSLNSIWVSHKAKKKESGPLHKETFYGRTEDGLLVVRKNVEGLSNTELSNIRDSGISKIIHAHLDEGKTLKDPIFMPSGTLIKKVRVTVKSNAYLTLNKGAQNEVYAQNEKTHHMSLFSLGDDKCAVEAVNMLTVAQRLQNRQPAYDKTPPPEHIGAEFMFHLSIGDTIMTTDEAGNQELYVYKTMAATSGQMFFVTHTDARPSTGESKMRLISAREGTFMKNFPNAEKVNILPTGEVRNIGH